MDVFSTYRKQFYWDIGVFHSFDHHCIDRTTPLWISHCWWERFCFYSVIKFIHFCENVILFTMESVFLALLFLRVPSSNFLYWKIGLTSFLLLALKDLKKVLNIIRWLLKCRNPDCIHSPLYMFNEVDCGCFFCDTLVLFVESKNC